MPKLPLDLSKFKKVAIKDGITTLKHDDGHELRLAHSALSPKLRGQLADIPMHKESGQANPKLEQAHAKFSKGGNVDPTQQHLMPGDKLPNNIEKGVVATAKKSVKMADGGKVDAVLKEKYENDQANNARINSGEEPLPDSAAVSDLTKSAEDVTPKKMADGGNVEPAPQANDAADEGSLPAPVATDDASSPVASLNATPSQTQIASGESAPASITPSSVAKAPSLDADADSTGFSTQQNMLKQGLEAGKAGLAKKAEAETQQGIEAGLAADARAQRELDVQSDVQQHAQEAHQGIANTIDKMHDGTINPTQYMENASVPTKILSVIGLLQSGLGKNNNITNYLQQQVDRDVAAQQASFNNKNTILGAYKQQFGNDRDAADYARLTNAGYYASLMDKAAANAATPQAAANLQLGKQQFLKEYAPLFQTAMFNRTMAGTMQSGGDPAAVLPAARVVRPEWAAQQEKLIVPGSGERTASNPDGNELAKIPVPQPVRDDITAKTNLIRSTQNLKDFLAQNGGIGKLSPSARAQAELYATELQGKYRQAMGASTSEGEKSDIRKVIPDQPLNLLSMINSSPKLNALEDSIGSSLNTTRSQYGLPQHPTSTMRQQTGQKPNQQPQIKTVNGVKYMRGPNGQAVPVK